MHFTSEAPLNADPGIGYIEWEEPDDVIYHLKCGSLYVKNNWKQERCCPLQFHDFIQFKMKAKEEMFFEVLKEMAEQPLNPMELIYKGEIPIFEKYYEFLPEELVKKVFAHGILEIDEMKMRIRSWE